MSTSKQSKLLFGFNKLFPCRDTPKALPQSPPPAYFPPVKRKIINESPLRRLRWPVFGPLADIMVVDDAADPRSPLSPLFDPTHPHPLLSESATTSPRPRLQVEISCIASWEFWESSKPPPSCHLIENKDGSPITIGQLVTECQSYCSKYQKYIHDIYDYEEGHPQWYFKYFSGPKHDFYLEDEDKDLVFSIHLFTDDSLNGSLEDMWGNIARWEQDSRLGYPAGPLGERMRSL